MDKSAALATLLGRVPTLTPGHVWLAGAGPGDPGLLTLDALAGLTQADVIVHDALVGERVLALAGPQAELEYAGKRGGRPSAQQTDISRRLIELARQNKRVLRLKGGDPCMFGRGGEEAIALAETGISFRIIPGITAGIAALSAASIPATMRGVNHAIIFATGHADADFDWAALAKTGQPIVIYMAMRNIEHIVTELKRGGLASNTPAAVIVSATTAEQRVLVSDLARLPDLVRELGFVLPGLVVIGALRRKGVAVRAAKSGPDYIDPAFHAAATGAKGVNLDSWAMPAPLIDALIADTTASADVLVIEGAMGLFDGVPGTPGRSGAASDLAARLNLPVLLILDVSGQSQSAAAVAAGFASYNPAVRVGGVVLNKLGSDRHRTLIADALKPLGIAVLGAIPRDETLVLPERHLGLVQASEHADLAARLERFAEVAARHLDLDAILAMAAPLAGHDKALGAALKPPGQRIALALDEAFSFVYAHVLDGWRRAGAEIVPFAPLRDEAPAHHCDVCWLPGGYPELHAGRLASARGFLDGLSKFAQRHPVHGECGGYMVLGEAIEDAQGVRHAMAGLLGHATSFAKRRLHLGYRQARLLMDNPIGAAGDVVRGHEFHHASITAKGNDEPFVDVTDAQGRTVTETGSRRGRVSGTFFHAIAREA